MRHDLGSNDVRYHLLPRAHHSRGGLVAGAFNAEDVGRRHAVKFNDSRDARGDFPSGGSLASSARFPRRRASLVHLDSRRGGAWPEQGQRMPSPAVPRLRGNWASKARPPRPLSEFEAVVRPKRLVEERPFMAALPWCDLGNKKAL